MSDVVTAEQIEAFRPDGLRGVVDDLLTDAELDTFEPLGHRRGRLPDPPVTSTLEERFPDSQNHTTSLQA